MTVSDYPDFATPGANAYQISQTGVPLLSAAQQVADMVTGTLTPGQSTAQEVYTYTLLGYEMSFQLQAGGAGATGPDYATILLQWQDGGSTIVVYEKAYTIAAGPNGAQHKITASGPARANRLIVTVTALAANPDNVIYTYTLLQTSRTYTRDRARTKSTADTNFLNLTQGSYVIESGNLLNTAPSGVAASGSATRVIAFWDGACYLKARTSLGGANLDVAVQDTTGLQASDGVVFHQVSDTNGNVGSELYLPSLQCVIVLKNLGGTAATLAAVLTQVSIDT